MVAFGGSCFFFQGPTSAYDGYTARSKHCRWALSDCNNDSLPIKGCVRKYNADLVSVASLEEHDFLVASLPAAVRAALDSRKGSERQRGRA